MKDVVPLCMNQYRRMFGTTRIPGVEEGERRFSNILVPSQSPLHALDTLQHVPTSRHVAVLYKGYFYVFDMITSTGHRLTALECERQLKAIVKDRETAPDPGVAG